MIEMDNKHKDISGYSVPEHYFDDLKGSIMVSIESGVDAVDHPSEIKVSWRVAFRRMGAFAAGFLLLVAMAGTVFYFTASRTQEGELADVDQEIFTLYSVDEDDILQIDEQLSDFDSLLLADVALSYVELYGYPEE